MKVKRRLIKKWWNAFGQDSKRDGYYLARMRKHFECVMDLTDDVGFSYKRKAVDTKKMLDFAFRVI